MSDDTYLSMDPKDVDLGHMLNDVDLVNSKNIQEAIEKAKEKLSQEVVSLLLSHPQMDETQENIDRVLF